MIEVFSKMTFTYLVKIAYYNCPSTQNQEFFDVFFQVKKDSDMLNF